MKVGDEKASQTSQDNLMEGYGVRVADLGRVEKIAKVSKDLEKILSLQEEWILLLRETIAHIDVLHTFLTPMNNTEQDARIVIEEFRRHMKALNLVFRSLLARQEVQVQLTQALSEDKSTLSSEGRANRLEKVIEYLVNIQGDDQQEVKDANPSFGQGMKFIEVTEPMRELLSTKEEHVLLLRVRESQLPFVGSDILQEEWILLLREINVHIDFLHTFFTPMNNTEQDARVVIEEFQRHVKTLNLAFRSLLARQEAHVQLTQALSEDKSILSSEGRANRLEKVIEYLVNIQGGDSSP